METLSYTIKDFCSATGLGRTKTFELLKTGQLNRIKVGNRTLIGASSARALLQQNDDQSKGQR